FKITPKRGQYYLLDKTVGHLVNTIIFQCPTSKGKGVVVAPTVHGNLIVGPDSEVIEDKDNTSTSQDRLQYVLDAANISVSNIPLNQVITTFAGIRAEPEMGDFIIEEVVDAPGFINVAGIKSPGLSSSPAIAIYVVDMVKNFFGDLGEKHDYNPV